MNKNSKVLAFSMLTLVLFSIASCVLRALACIRDMESNLIYFSNNSLITAANIVAISGIVILAAFSIIMESERIKANFTAPITYVPTGIAAVTVALFGLVMLAIYTALNKVSPSGAMDTTATLALVTALLSPVSVAHFFLTTFLHERHARLRAYFALGTVLMLAAYTSYLYFNTSAPLNAQNKIAEEMACLFAAIFFLFETRISLGREMWRPYAAFGLVAALLTAYASIPSIICYFVKGVCPGATVEAAAMLLGLSIFIFARLVMMAMAYPDAEAPEMTVLREWAERREEELRTGKIEDGTQISISELIDIPDNATPGDVEPTEEDAEADSPEESDV